MTTNRMRMNNERLMSNTKKSKPFPNKLLANANVIKTRAMRRATNHRRKFDRSFGRSSTSFNLQNRNERLPHRHRPRSFIRASHRRCHSSSIHPQRRLHRTVRHRISRRLSLRSPPHHHHHHPPQLPVVHRRNKLHILTCEIHFSLFLFRFFSFVFFCEIYLDVQVTKKIKLKPKQSKVSNERVVFLTD